MQSFVNIIVILLALYSGVLDISLVVGLRRRVKWRAVACQLNVGGEWAGLMGF
ncbi:hypothetical protein PUN32_09435 [Vibrio sp. dsl-7]|uniref:Uncharacterized protein n=1 Tax=Vibrio chanodichtyis TaxID=3027932 RepID=A0ABT5V4J0_9VIBR|nr:hypothetical protein [Vibrio chanodichtyis]MDE1515235.1 hypothetical protein [Vibrio chanodichtyis]